MNLPAVTTPFNQDQADYILHQFKALLADGQAIAFAGPVLVGFGALELDNGVFYGDVTDADAFLIAVLWFAEPVLIDTVTITAPNGARATQSNGYPLQSGYVYLKRAAGHSWG